MSDRRLANNRTRSIWTLQLALAMVVVLVAATSSVLDPVVLATPRALGGILLIIAVTMATLMVPWARIRTPWVALVPYADIVGIGLMADGSEPGVRFLWVFPVVWLATYFALHHLVVGLSGIVVIMFVDGLVTTDSSLGVVHFGLVALSLVFIGISLYLSTRQSGALRRLLWRHSRRLQQTVEVVSAQERRVTQTLNALDQGVVRVSSTGAVISANEAFIGLYARDRDDISAPGASVEYSEYRGEVLRDARRTLSRAAAGDHLHGERVWLYDRDGEWHALDVTTRALPSTAEEGASALVTIDDVTSLLELQQRRDRLATAISHELRNPLAAIVGHVDLLLERRSATGADRERLLIINDAAERMTGMISRILESSRMAGTAGIRVSNVACERVDLGSLIEASVESFLPTAAARDVTLTTRSSGVLVINGDGFRLRQAIDNLVSNAIKYTSHTGIVEVAARVSDGCAVIVVADNGSGISAEDLPRVFDDYFRAESALESESAGTGLGMGIVREIAQWHDGDVDVVSEPGIGTTVTIRFPVGTNE